MLSIKDDVGSKRFKKARDDIGKAKAYLHGKQAEKILGGLKDLEKGDGSLKGIGLDLKMPSCRAKR